MEDDYETYIDTRIKEIEKYLQMEKKKHSIGINPVSNKDVEPKLQNETLSSWISRAYVTEEDFSRFEVANPRKILEYEAEEIIERLNSKKSPVKANKVTITKQPIVKIKDEMVECYDKSKHLYSECLYYDGKYYHSSHKDFIVEDCINGHLLIRKNAIPVYTSINIINGKFNGESNYTSRWNYEFTVPFHSYKHGFSGRIVNENNITGWENKESISEGQLVDIDYKEQSLDQIIHYDNFKNIYLDENLDKKTQIKMGIKSPSHQLTEGIKYSFGAELELARGFIPSWKSSKFNLSAMRDGSLNAGAGGLELVTGVLRGDTGLFHLQEICKEIEPKTSVDKYCSIHTHIGGLDFSNKFLVNIYLLCQIIEKEMLLIVPPSRRGNTYCRNLKKFDLSPALNIDDIKLKEDYFKLFEWISYEKITNPTFNYNKTKQHPLGAKCGYNHETPRYCWLNLVPAMFNTRGDMRWKTLEFRLHEGSTNYTKIHNWILLCMAIVKLADKYPEAINNNITISDILLKIYPRKGEKLVEYFNKRKEIFNSSIFVEKEWYKDDNRFSDKKIKTIKELNEL